MTIMMDKSKLIELARMKFNAYMALERQYRLYFNVKEAAEKGEFNPTYDNLSKDLTWLKIQLDMLEHHIMKVANVTSEDYRRLVIIDGEYYTSLETLKKAGLQ